MVPMICLCIVWIGSAFWSGGIKVGNRNAVVVVFGGGSIGAGTIELSHAAGPLVSFARYEPTGFQWWFSRFPWPKSIGILVPVWMLVCIALIPIFYPGKRRRERVDE